MQLSGCSDLARAAQPGVGGVNSFGGTMPDHLFSIYLPWSSEPIFETLIQAELWHMIQFSAIFCGLAATSYAIDKWTEYRERTQSRKLE